MALPKPRESCQKLMIVTEHKFSDVFRVLLIPGAGTLPPSEWSDDIARDGLLTPAIPVDAGVYAFEHRLNAQKGLNRARIEAEGAVLVSLIKAHCERRSAPLILMSHSLGGIVLKHALRLAFERGLFSSLRIVCCILFSCPNFKYGTAEERLSLLSISNTFSRMALRQNDSDALLPGLVEDARLFLEAIDDTPVCSVFEERSESGSDTHRPVVCSCVHQYSCRHKC